MDLSNVDLESSRERAQSAKEAETRAEEGDDVQLVFHLPGGSTAKASFKAGVTVAFVKLKLEQDHGLKMASTTLKIGGKVLIDPLSLSDCPGIVSGREVDVAVEVKG